MFSDRWNANIKLTRLDRLFGATLGKIIPTQLLPNHFTVLRMIMTPIVIYILHVGNYRIGVPLFLLAAYTDAIDGALARTRKQITEWGTLFDPIADKLLIGSTLFVIVLDHINYKLGLALLAVEVLIIGGSIYSKLKNNHVEPANFWGKLKMFAEVLGILLLLTSLWSGINLFVDLSNGVLAIALVAALTSVLWRIR